MKLEQELIQACLRNDRKAQRQLYQQYAGGMLVVCMRYVNNKAEAEDILQDAFIKVFHYLGSFRGESTLGAWIKRIVVNTALRHIQNAYTFDDLEAVDRPNGKIEESVSGLQGLQFQELITLIHQLPKGCQTIFNLFAIECFQHNEIAEMLHISEGTSKSQYARAKQLLQQQLLLERKRTDNNLH